MTGNQVIVTQKKIILKTDSAAIIGDNPQNCPQEMTCNKKA